MRWKKWLPGMLLFLALVLAAWSYQAAYGSLNGKPPAALHQRPGHHRQVKKPALAGRRKSRRQKGGLRILHLKQRNPGTKNQFHYRSKV